MTLPQITMVGVLRGPLQNLSPMALALGIGALGGFIASSIGMPLPWMMGPMILCTLACLLDIPVRAPIAIRPPMLVVLGLMLGSSFTPEILDRGGEFAISLVTMGVFLAVAASLIYPFLRRVGGFDQVTAYFSAMPGGLNDMVIIGGQLGGDERRIALIQASRVLLTVLTVPVLMQIFSSYEAAQRDDAWTRFTDVTPSEYGLFILGGILGWIIGKMAKFPAPILTGPMLASAILHGGGFMESQPPTLIVSIAQLIMGTVIGCRFVGTAREEVFFILRISAVSTAILIILAGIFALMLTASFGLDFEGLILAYAPGGMAEMGLIALALGVDTAFVATHHVIRIAAVIAGAKVFFDLLNKFTPQKKPH